MATYDEYAQFFDRLTQGMSEQQFYKVLDFSLGAIRMWRLINDRLFTLVRVTDATESSNATLDIVGAGACGMQPHGELFRYLATPDENLAYGSCFASIRADRTVLSGARHALPLAILDRNSPDCTRFIVHTIDRLGVYARQTAEGLMARFGGKLLDGQDEDDVSNLFAAASGH